MEHYPFTADQDAPTQLNKTRDNYQGQKDGKQHETKEIIALIAYLQRLGTDISKPPPTPDEPVAVAGVK